VDSKEQWQLKRMVERIRSGDFSEDDVYVLLLTLRRFACPGRALREFGDFLAHREKDRGILFEYVKEIKEALDRPLPFSGTISIRPVISSTQLADEINEIIGRSEIIPLSSVQMNHVMVCVISLLQCVELQDRDGLSIGQLHVAASPEKILLIGKILLPHLGGLEAFFEALSASNDLLDITLEAGQDWIMFNGVSWARSQQATFTINQYETDFLG
jgi:hypothetical protein